MQEYDRVQKPNLIKLVCNKCGKTMLTENGIVKEGVFTANVSFGYFSRKDGARHHFDLCEDCYDQMIAGFVIPVESTEEM